MTTLYHGSYMAVEHPLVHVGRDDLDFGKGFYLTNMKPQAEKWAANVSADKEGAQATVNVYDFDQERAIADGYRYHGLMAYNIEWLRFVANSRTGRKPWRGYDIIEGGVANDRVVDTVEDFLRGRMTARQALRKLVYVEPTHQLCLLRQEVADKYLQYKESYKI